MTLERAHNEQPLPISERIKTLSPICEGQLYAHEVLILFYAHKYTTSTNLYEGFWEYKYGISDMNAQIESLHARGFLRIGTLEEAMNTATLSTLKNIAKKNGLKTSGKKSDIIHRILSTSDSDSLNNIFPDKPYFLTELGQHVIKRENYMKYIHNWSDSNINIWNFSKMAHEFLSLPYTKILQQYYSQQSEKHLYQKQYGLYRNDRFFMAESAREENNYDMSLIWLFEIIYYDLSGLNNFFDGTYPEKNAPRLFPYEYSSARIAKGILSRITLCQEKLNISEIELKEKMITVLSGIKLPFQIFTLEECVDIFLLELHQDKTNLEKIYKTAENRYRTNHPSNEDILRYKMLDDARAYLTEQAKEESNIYDAEFEQMIEERLSKLDDLSRAEFYRLRHNKNDGVLSSQELDLLTLEAMEKSYNYKKDK